MALGPVYDYIDGKWLGHSLRMPEKKRLEIRQRARELPDDLPGWRVSKTVMYTVLAQLAAMVIVAWVVSALSHLNWAVLTRLAAVHLLLLGHLNPIA